MHDARQASAPGGTGNLDAMSHTASITPASPPTSPDPAIGPAIGSPALQLSGVVKRFGSVAAVDDLDLVVEPGEIVAFLGPNGAGKTTTIDMMLGLARPDQGTVRVLGGRPG